MLNCQAIPKVLFKYNTYVKKIREAISICVTIIKAMVELMGVTNCAHLLMRVVVVQSQFQANGFTKK